MTFYDFDFEDSLLEGLDTMGYKTPTPIQEQAIPIAMSGKDLIACAQTGTGKTAAYLLPVLNKIIQTDSRHLNTLILAPTRELAQQIDQQIEGLAYYTGVSSIAVYGGGDGAIWEQQKRAIKQGVDIIIATPGRLISFLSSGGMKLDGLQHLVLDEADRMLDMGFYDDIMRIISFLPIKRQTLLFSATMPPKIRTLTNTILKNPEQVNISISKPAAGINQQAYMVYDNQKLPLIKKILTEGTFNSILIFASTKENVKKLSNELGRLRMGVTAFHSDLEQNEREEIMRGFKSRRIPIIVGTDVLSRGIDVDGIDLVVNYDVPPDPEDYIHRIGRTARAESTGTAITFITDTDQHKFARIEQLISKEVPKLPVPESLGEAPTYNPLAKKQHRPFGNSSGKKGTWKGKKK